MNEIGRQRLKQFGVFAAMCLLAAVITGWIYRDKIDVLICNMVISRIYENTALKIDYGQLKADLSSLEATDVVIVAEKTRLSVNYMRIEYDKSILFAKNRIARLKSITLNNFDLAVSDEPKHKTDIAASAPIKRKIFADLLGNFNCILSLNNGKVEFGGKDERRKVEIDSASLVRSAADNDFEFTLLTGSGGLMPQSNFRGIFEPSLPGYFQAEAEINILCYGNKWFLEKADFDCKWSLDGEFTAAFEAVAGDADLQLSYYTNIFDDEESELNIQTRNIVLSRQSGLNKLYISKELLAAVDDNWRELLTDNYITGNFSSNTMLKFSPSSSSPEIDLRLKVSDGVLTYWRFPYKLEGVQGDIILKDQALTAAMKTTVGDEIQITARAFFDGSKGDKNGIDVRIESPSLAADSKLYQALDDQSKLVWLAFAPQGRVCIDYHLFVNEDEHLEYLLDIYPLEGNICYKDFPYPISKLTGKITISESDVWLTNVAGYNGDGKVVANGAITGLGSDSPRVGLEFVCTDVAVAQELITPLPEVFKEKLNRFEFFESFADITVDVDSSDDDNELVFDVKAQVEAKKIEYLPAKLIFEDVGLDARFFRNRLDINRFDGQIHNQQIGFNGGLKLPETGEVEYDIEFEALCENIERLAAAFGVFETDEAIITGAVDVSGKLQATADEFNYEAKLLCSNAAINIGEKFPEIEQVKGEINIVPLKVEYDIQGRLTQSKGAIVQSSGIFDYFEPYDGSLSLHIKDINPQSPLLPKDLQLGDSGGISISLPNSTIKNGSLRCDAAAVNFNDISIAEKFIKGANGFIECPVELAAGGALEITDGVVSFDELTIYGRKVQNLAARFEYHPTAGFKMNSSSIAKVCDGEVSGSFVFVSADNDSFAVTLDFFNIDADKLINAGDEDILKQHFDLDGRLSGMFHLSGNLGDSSTRFGRFDFDVQNVRAEDKTLVNKVLRAIFTLSPGTTMESLRVRAGIRQDTVSLEDVAIAMPLMLLRGSGDIDIANQKIALELAAQGIPIIDNNFLSDILFLRAIGRKIARVEVSGDITDPKIEVTTFGVLKR